MTVKTLKQVFSSLIPTINVVKVQKVQTSVTRKVFFPGGGTWVKFCWVCAAGISEPLPHYSLFLVYFVANYKPHLSHFWAND